MQLVQGLLGWQEDHSPDTDPGLYAGSNLCQSHIFGGHIDVNCSASLQTVNVLFGLKRTTNIHVTPSTLISKA